MNRIVPLILAVALFMEQMDSTVISTALPAIAADLGVGPITLKLALTAYMVALAIFIPISGWMADRFGAKRVFRLAIIVFMVGSVLCAISSSLVGFVLARFLQGMGGAMMTPVGRLVLLRTTKRSELVNAMALLTIPALVGPLAGPPLGGFITTFFTWHWIFLINIPVGVAGLWLTGIYLPEVPATSPPPLDIGGLILTALAAAASSSACRSSACRRCRRRSASSRPSPASAAPSPMCCTGSGIRRRSSISACSAMRPSGWRRSAARSSASRSAPSRS